MNDPSHLPDETDLTQGLFARIAPEGDVEVIHRRDRHGQSGKTVGHADPEADTQITPQEEIGDRVERQKWKHHRCQSQSTRWVSMCQ